MTLALQISVSLTWNENHETGTDKGGASALETYSIVGVKVH